MNSIFKYICIPTFIVLNASSIYANDDTQTDIFLIKLLAIQELTYPKEILKHTIILTEIFSSNGLIIHAVMDPLSGMLTFMQKILL